MRSFTNQEDFWKGEFGDAYAARNQSDTLLASNLAFFSRILPRAGEIRSVIEFGANVGMNLRALRLLLPGAVLSGLEINAGAAGTLRESGICEQVFCESLFDFDRPSQWDLALIKGVLIHLAPELLPGAYDVLYRSSKRYLCLAEYYSPTPVEVPYRGHADRLFKRDFAGELLARFPDLRLVDYGFSYHKDPTFPQDDITWFLLEKSNR